MRVILLIIVLFLVNVVSAQNPEGFDEMCRDTIKGTVPAITVAELIEARKDEPHMIILDAREKTEFKISHLKGAINVGYDKFNLNALNGIPKNAPICIYCSIGYRSEKIGEKLVEAGYINVHNLFGGIFSWYNNGNPVVDFKDQKTNRIHGYDEEWSKWLNPEKGKIVIK